MMRVQRPCIVVGQLVEKSLPTVEIGNAGLQIHRLHAEQCVARIAQAATRLGICLDEFGGVGIGNKNGVADLLHQAEGVQSLLHIVYLFLRTAHFQPLTIDGFLQVFDLPPL